MKNSLIITVFALLAALAIQSAAVSAQGSDINLVLTKQTPYPVEPGQVVSIEVSLQNNGSSSEGITLEIVPAAPFTLLPGQEAVKTFSRIDALDTVQQSYKLKVDDSAVSATYELEFRYYRSGSQAVVKKVPISVEGLPKIVISEITTDPVSIQPGDEVEIGVVLKNEGTGEAQQTELSLVSQTVAGESIIVPVLSGGVFYMGTFMPGEEKTATFRLKVENTAEYKSYLSTLTVNYVDETGNSGTITYDIGIPVKGRPILSILNTEIDSGEFKVELNNIGTAAAKGIKISLVQEGQTKGVSVVSEIKAGKYKAVRFADYVYGPGMLNISYYDESNNFKYEESEVYVQKPASNGSAGGGTDYTAATILGIVVVAETVYIWRLRKHRKK